eukprot:Phypoly_transcript_01035.p1 GENE.Phypoly_transcript_01035~~Phypoly_transcript_01035.p1  ORF type:complete len:1202 (+),score=298.44 Phypoly_transcript_01035:116-3721(+)
MSNKKVVKSAVIVMPPPEMWEDIQDIRKENDKAYGRWPPHINMLYPFVPVDEFPAVAPKIAKAIEAISPFAVTFENFSFFPHGTIFCDPQTKIEKSLHTLQSALESAVPYCNDQSSKAGGFHPHLTVGQVPAGETPEGTITNFLKYWNPINFNVDRVYLIAREGDDPFRIKYQIFLKDGRFEPLDIPYTVEPKKEEKVEEEVTKTGGTQATGFQIGPTHVRVLVEAPAAQVGGAAINSQKQLVFVLDISGSMCSFYGQLNEAVKYMLDTKPAREPFFILFDDKARLVTAHEAQNIKNGGGTYFTAALEEITKLLISDKVDPNLEVAVVFMTDGQDGNRSKLPATIDTLRDQIKKMKKKVVVHTIGFGSGADVAFLNTIRAIGPEEGMMRRVNDTKLTTSFAEIFDFLDLTKTFQITFKGAGTEDLVREVEAEMKKVQFEDVVSVDLVYSNKQPEYSFFMDKTSVPVELGDYKHELTKQEADIFFTLRGVEAMEITTQEQLQEAQNMLTNLNALKAPKAQRQEAVEMKTEIQEQLNKFHQAFADLARGTAAASQITSTLQSLRYDFKFNKSRRVRTMNQRATKNAAVFADIEKRLAAIKLSDEAIQSFSGLEYICPLSGDSIQEIMGGSPTDVMMFSLRVTRPEHAIDAPTQVAITEILAGTYSNFAFQQSMTFALRSGNAANAHGGFSEKTEDNVGFFKGPDGKYMNACLPLYINEHHWKRVEVQLEPLLGYFFTLDPLGFKGDQYLALFMILGNMLIMRLNGQFKSEWADFLIDDFKKLCTAIKPKVLKYLKSGFYAGGLLTEDPLEAFLASPKGRTKQVLQNIMVIVGWAECCENYDKKQFQIALIEEIWRRNFSTFYKAQPREIVMDTIEKLIYGPPLATEKNLDGLVSANKLNKNDKDFMLWAEWKLGKASNRKAKEIEQTMKDGPEILGTLPPDAGYESRQIVEYDVHKDFFKQIVEEELNKIKETNKFFYNYTNGEILGENMAPSTQWLLVLQALQFCSNDLANSGVASGSYKNSWEYLDKPQEIMKHLHEFFDTHRKQNWEACIRDKNTLITAQQIVATKDIWAYLGRMMKSCPTRGGAVFDAVVAYLHSPPANLTPVTRHADKIDIIFTGKFKQGDEPEMVVHAEGSSWVHCSTELAKKFKAAIGDEKFALIESKMYGHWGWVYRPSDLPNRHGYHNSHPNPALSRDFRGFGI